MSPPSMDRESVVNANTSNDPPRIAGPVDVIWRPTVSSLIEGRLFGVEDATLLMLIKTHDFPGPHLENHRNK